MLDRTTAYAKLVVSGKRHTCEAERLCCQRHLDFLKRRDIKFDKATAEKHIDFANMLTIGTGTKEQLKTRGFQNFIIGSLYGWKNKDGTRLFREAYIQMARQNSKSFLCGVFSVFSSTMSKYQNGTVYCTATKQDQADIVWNKVKEFIESDDDLNELYRIQEHIKTITSLITGTKIKSIGRDTKTADGFASVLAVVDEYHAHPTSQMYKLMFDGQSANPNALTAVITTAGFNLSGPCYEHYNYCKDILNGIVDKDSQFIYIAEADSNPYSEEAIIEANPLLAWKDDRHIDTKAVARYMVKAKEAEAKGGSEAVNYKTKTCDIWVTAPVEAFLDLKQWQACGSDAKELKGDCYLGVDLSSGGDLTSIAMVFPNSNGKPYIYTKSWMPIKRMEEHEKSDKVPYREWANAGLIELTTGNYGIKTDYKAVCAFLRECRENGVNFLSCGYDNHNAAAFLPDLEEAVECDLVEIRQSAMSLNDATRDFQLTVEAGGLEYDKKNQLLTWSMAHAILTHNSFKEIKIDKYTYYGERIDPCDAVIDAWKLYFRTVEKDDEQESLAVWYELYGKNEEQNN